VRRKLSELSLPSQDRGGGGGENKDEDEDEADAEEEEEELEEELDDRTKGGAEYKASVSIRRPASHCLIKSSVSCSLSV
jgi:hypothetical protein